MISRGQQILVKRAMREAGLTDEEYRDALETVSGCRSTKDAKMTDRAVDLVLSYFEAIYWRAVDAGTLPAPCKPDAVFRQRGYWAARNPGGNTSRDRYTAAHPAADIAGLEAALGALGFGPDYCAAIRRKAMAGQDDARAQYIYQRALERTLRAKQAARSGRRRPQFSGSQTAG